MQYELSQEESDLLKAGLYFQSNQIKFENPKSSLPLKRFTVHFLATLNIKNKNKCISMQFDIEEFYFSTSKKLLLKAFTCVKTFVNNSEEEIVMHSRKFLPSHNTDV